MKTLLLMIYLLYILHLGEFYGDWQHPHYSYRCLENEKLELFGPHHNSLINVCGEENNENCTSIKADSNGVFSIKYSCMKYDNTQYSAIVSVQDSEFGEESLEKGCYSKPLTTNTSTLKRRRKRADQHQNSPQESSSTSPDHNPTDVATTQDPATTKSIPITTPNYVGGKSHHEFLIICKDIPEEGINKTVAHVFQEKNFNKLPDNYKEVAPVEMRFKAVDDINGPDINTIYIGDEFYMFIIYMGEEDYTVIPEECNAFDEPWIEKGLSKTASPHKVELWNINDYKQNRNKEDCAKNKELLEKFYNYNTTFRGVIYAKMYGFRFQGKEFITITCRVRIYRKSKAPQDSCVDPIQTSPTRRKRSIENMPFQTKEITKKLRVVDNVYLAENNSQQLKWASSLWIMIFATITVPCTFSGGWRIPDYKFN